MIISRVEIRNYRSLKDVTLDVTDYSVLAGANGAGKSSVLYALDWFFNGGTLAPTDVTGYVEGTTPDHECFIEVAVTFRDLTAHDRERLRQYGRGASATFRRTWRVNENDKIVGNALQGPGFAEIRTMTRVTEMRSAYKALGESVPDLPDLGPSPTKDAINDALSAWEDKTSNGERLIDVDDAEANHMFGINGPNVINECVRLILVPAATDISAQVGDASNKKSALNVLIGAVMSDAGTRAMSAWMTENAAVLDHLQDLVRESVETSTKLQSSRVNSRLEALIPTAKLSLTPIMPDWAPKANASVRTDVTVDGVTHDISRQGHGVQRAVMMSMFEALAPDEDSTREAHTARTDENHEDAKKRLEEELARLPVLIVCIEEPEIYQHPVRARTFARTLTELSEKRSAQVLVATHSPYFVRPEQFPSLHRFTLEAGRTSVASTSTVDLEKTTRIPADRIAKIIDKRVPTSFSEGFFADAVVLTEGDTDRAIIEAMASKMGLDLDARGISVIEVSSKQSLRIPCEIFTALGIPTYIVADADYLGADRKHPNDKEKRDQAHDSHLRATKDLVDWAPGSDGVPGSGSYVPGAPTSTSNYLTLWHDDLEHELDSWPSFLRALDNEGYANRCKNLYAYRSAVMDATIKDIPKNLKNTIKAISEFRISRSSTPSPN